ncbi:MAG: biotin/lipoyl-binding protein [Rectinemataceae bacterium]|jgi:multidrug efflux pump subunit AcrA (membrane-fusion protein)
MNHQRSIAFHASAFRVFLALLGAAGLALALAGCSAGHDKNASATGSAAPGSNGAVGNHGGAISVMADLAPEGPLTVVSDTSGTVNPVTQSKVAAQIAGTVAKVLHLAGDWVKAGDTVIQLDDSQLQLSVKMARSALDNAKITLSTTADTTNQANPKLALQVRSGEAALAAAQKNYDSAKALFKVGGATASQVDSAQSQLQLAQANLESAKTDLDQNQKADVQTLAQLRIAVEQADNQLKQAELNLQYAAVKAPFDGQLSVVNMNPGEYVGVATIAFVLVSVEKEVDFSVPPTDATHLGVGTKLNFAYEGRIFQIEVRQPPSAPVNGMVPMVASPPSSFPIAYGAVGTVGYSLTLARGILLPIATLETNEDKNYVFLVKDGKAMMQTITIIAESGITAAVSGIAPGSQVIVSPPPGLLDGSPVQVVQAQGANAPAGGQAGKP